jgi:predicted 3-demethylubiquinone-9 3-methyltransferase (glyoxalase superfamily)
MQKTKPCLWFDDNAKEAVEYYISVFPDSKMINTMYYPNSVEEGLAEFQMNMAGKELVIDFELNGQRYMALNGGPKFKFDEAISFAIGCKDQAEIDYYWEKLSSVPEAEQCGWCKDRFGLSWQVVPENVTDLLGRPNAYVNMMKMKKLVIANF